MPRIDYLIVGQGLAGSCLALEFLKRGKKFLLVDQPRPNSASKVAAGLFNPITGRTNQPTWMASKFFNCLMDFYRNAEEISGDKFLHPIPIYRPFLSTREQTQWPEESSHWISSVSLKSRYPDLIHDPFGGIEIRGSGYLNTIAFLSTVKKMLIMNESFLEEDFIHPEVLSDRTIRYKNIEAPILIYCDGTEALANPFFHWLPIIKLKGEILQIKATLPPDVVINRGIFTVPAENAGIHTLGATYHRDPTQGNTERGIEELVANARKLFINNFETIGQNWGHRPTTIDRRPVLGLHPVHHNVIIFNGLGTKGVSLAPFFAIHLSDYLEGKTELDKEVNIERFYSLHFKR